MKTTAKDIRLDFKYYSPRIGHPDWDEIAGRVDKLVEEASGVVEFDNGSPREKIAEGRRIADALARNAISMAKNYWRLKRGDQNLLPSYFIWTMHNTCNFRCAYCDNHREQKYFDLPNEGLLDTGQGKKLLKICREDVTGIYFCGGEPTLRRDLPELTDYAHSINYFPLMINTNGSRLHKMLPDPRYSKWLKRMDIIIVSLDALDIGQLSKTWGMKSDVCKQVIVNILTLRQLQKKVRFKLIVNTVITPDTISEADSILDWANDLGIWYSPVPMNCGPTSNGNLTSMPEYRALVDKIIRRKRRGHKILGSRKLISRLLNGDAIKCYPTLKPHVDVDGSLLWPCKGMVNAEPEKINVLQYKSMDDAYKAAARIINPNDFHGHAPGQCGADCNWMQNYVSDAVVRGLKNPLKGNLIPEIAEFVAALN